MKCPFLTFCFLSFYQQAGNDWNFSELFNFFLQKMSEMLLFSQKFTYFLTRRRKYIAEISSKVVMARKKGPLDIFEFGR